jgi:hypothetical protein
MIKNTEPPIDGSVFFIGMKGCPNCPKVLHETGMLNKPPALLIPAFSLDVPVLTARHF